MTRGFILGKFLPPHNGHVFLCDFARSCCDGLTILVCTRDGDPIPGDLRYGWMREMFPECRVLHPAEDVPQEPADHADFWEIWCGIVERFHPEPVDIIHIDAHLDFVDERHGVRHGHGNPLRRASELGHVTGMTQMGIRNVSSSNRSDYDDAREAGADILSVRDVRRLGTEGVLARVPKGVRYYCTIDIDGFDPSIAPGTGTPSHGGFLYYEVLEIMQGLSKQGEFVGIDLVEVAPDYDHSGITAMLSAQLLMNMLGFIFHERKQQG